MREINVREDGMKDQKSATQIIFGEDGEIIEYGTEIETFTIEDGEESVCLYVRDVPFLMKALEELQTILPKTEETDLAY